MFDLVNFKQLSSAFMKASGVGKYRGHLDYNTFATTCLEKGLVKKFSRADTPKDILAQCLNEMQDNLRAHTMTFPKRVKSLLRTELQILGVDLAEDKGKEVRNSMYRFVCSTSSHPDYETLRETFRSAVEKYVSSMKGEGDDINRSRETMRNGLSKIVESHVKELRSSALNVSNERFEFYKKRSKSQSSRIRNFKFGALLICTFLVLFVILTYTPMIILVALILFTVVTVLTVQISEEKEICESWTIKHASMHIPRALAGYMVFVSKRIDFLYNEKQRRRKEINEKFSTRRSEMHKRLSKQFKRMPKRFRMVRSFRYYCSLPHAHTHTNLPNIITDTEMETKRCHGEHHSSLSSGSQEKIFEHMEFFNS